MWYVYLIYRTIRMDVATTTTVVTVKEIVDFQHKNIKGCLKTKMSSFFD